MKGRLAQVEKRVRGAEIVFLVRREAFVCGERKISVYLFPFLGFSVMK